MSISIAERVIDTVVYLKQEIQSTIDQYNVHIMELEHHNFYPDLANCTVMTRVDKLSRTIQAALSKLMGYIPFTPEIEAYITNIEDTIEALATRFMKWTRREVISTKQAMERFERSRSTIYRWIRSGKLIAEKLNGRWTIAL